jgi:hypothetical protein
MNIDPAVLNKLVWSIGVMAVVVAAGISAIFQLIGGFLERRAADKRHLRDIALRAAIVQWEFEIEETKRKNQHLLRLGEPLTLNEVSFDMILVKKLKLIETFGKRNLTPKDIEKGIREMGTIAGAIERGFAPHKSDSK